MLLSKVYVSSNSNAKKKIKLENVLYVICTYSQHTLTDSQ